MALGKIALSHADRLELTKILSTAKFKTLDAMGFAIDDAKAIAHTAEEVKKINLRAINEGQNLTWDEDEVMKTVDLSEASRDAVLAAVKAHDDAGDWTLAEQGLRTLATKLK